MGTNFKSIAPKNVVNLYDITGVTPLAGISDYTDGIYNGNPHLDHDVAQKNQHNYLLDEIGANEGFRLLDVGCGLGTLLETARERGIAGVGITISKDQVRRCKSKGLDVHLINYKNIPEEWNGMFDGIIANGSLEHFCQPEDAMNGEQDKIYKNMFIIFSNLLDNNSFSQRVATTAIHFRAEHMDPRKLLMNPLLQLLDREGFHASILYRGYGGYYPRENQLEKSANDHFILVKKVDGTEDYHITSEHWCKEYRKALFTNPAFIRALSGHLLKHPMHTIWIAASYVGPQSWAWQFRGDISRAVLYRHTWEKRKDS